MKTKNSFLLALGLFGLTATTFAQVGINNSAANPDASAILDLKSGNSGVNKGFLPQSVALTNVTVAAPVVTPATGLIVYSTNAPTGGNGKGYYYWNGSAWASLNNTINGAGTNAYVAVWTPNGTTLGTGLIQDNGANVGIGFVPTAGYMVISEVTSGSALGMQTSDAAGYGGDFFNLGGVAVNANGSTTGIVSYGGSAYGAQLSDGSGDYSYAGDVTNGYGINAYGVNEGGYFSDTRGDYAWIADGGYFSIGAGANIGSANGNYSVLGDDNTGSGIYSYGATYGSEAFDAAGDYLYGGNDANGEGLYAYGTTYGGVVTDAAGDYAYMAENGNTRAIEGDDAVGDWGLIADGSLGIGGYFTDAAGDYSYIGYAGSAIYSTGAKNTIVQDQNGKYRGMTCPEAPEVLFQDYGTSQLINGKIHIDLDKLFAYTVVINEKHPLRVMVTLNDECNGVFVTNRTSTGFDVVELNHGSSNASFTYEVVANRADSKTFKGVARNYSEQRYQDAPGPLQPSKAKAQKAPQHNRVQQAPAKVAPVKQSAQLVGPAQSK